MRYHAEARSAFHRNYQALMKSLANEEPSSEAAPEVPKTSARPIEPSPSDDQGDKTARDDSQAVAPPAGSGSTAVSPNEARPVAVLPRRRGVFDGREEVKDVAKGSNPPPIGRS